MLINDDIEKARKGKKDFGMSIQWEETEKVC
jgi:hypothetical protein